MIFPVTSGSNVTRCCFADDLKKFDESIRVEILLKRNGQVGQNEIAEIPKQMTKRTNIRQSQNLRSTPREHSAYRAT